MCVPRLFIRHWSWSKERAWWLLCACLLIASLALLSCSGLSFGNGNGSGGKTPTAQPAAADVALNALHWCGKPLQIFRDEHAPVSGTATPAATSTVTPSANGTPTTVTDWSQVEPNLGFTVYLPKTLPRATCLVSVSATIHDPIFGGSFTIGYLLPDHSPLSLSEAPLRSNSQSFQCSATTGAKNARGGSPTPTASPSVHVLVCTGAKEITDIFFSARGTESQLKQFFDALQSGVEWAPTTS